VLSGAADVRTPFEQAQVVAAEIPGASVLEVPNVGHAVLLNDPSGCATRALGAFFAGTPVAPCGLAAPPPVDPLPPGAVATLPAAAPLTGLPGQVLTASVLTLRHEVGITAPYAENLLAGPIAGTLAGNLVGLVPGLPLFLSGLSYVPGVAISGTVSGGAPYGTGRLTVDLGGRHYGVLRLVKDGTIRGTLGGGVFTLGPAARNAIDTAGGLDFAIGLK
jgi:hypothetical protein